MRCGDNTDFKKSAEYMGGGPVNGLCGARQVVLEVIQQAMLGGNADSTDYEEYGRD